MRQNRSEREQTEEEQAAEDGGAPAVAIGNPTQDQRPEEAGEEPGAEHAAKRRWAHMPFAYQRRTRKGGGADVIAVGHDPIRKAMMIEFDVEGADFLAVDDGC